MDSWKSYSTRSDNYAAEKAAALAQSKQNSYMQGLQSVHETGFGQSISDSRDGKYGNVNIMPQQLIQGADNNFQQPGDAGSMPLASAANQTGMLETQTSATKEPSVDPATFETSALDERLRKMAKGGMHNLNDRSALYPQGG